VVKAPTATSLRADPLRQRCRRALADHRARAKADGVTLRYGLADLEALARAELQCAYCRLPVGWDFQIDHRTPTSRGGKHALSNLAVACARCNQIKGKLTEQEYRELLALARAWHPAAAEDLLGRLRSGWRRYRG
jgi:5-methylcytosine-specific restriction endonuclease McrA